MDSQFQHEAERDGLVDAATTDERAEAVEVVEITTGAVGAKRKKATRIESLQNKVAAATEKIEKKQKLVATAVSKQSLRAKEKESLQRWETELNNLFNERRAAQESLQVLLDAREQQDTTKAAKAIEQLERAERVNARHMSEAGVHEPPRSSTYMRMSIHHLPNVYSTKKREDEWQKLNQHCSGALGEWYGWRKNASPSLAPLSPRMTPCSPSQIEGLSRIASMNQDERNTVLSPERPGAPTCTSWKR